MTWSLVTGHSHCPIDKEMTLYAGYALEMWCEAQALKKSQPEDQEGYDQVKGHFRHQSCKQEIHKYDQLHIYHLNYDFILYFQS